MKHSLIFSLLISLVSLSAQSVECKIDLKVNKVGDDIVVTSPGKLGLEKLVDDDGYMTLSLLRYSWAESAKKNPGWSIPTGDIALFKKVTEVLINEADRHQKSFEADLKSAGLEKSGLSQELLDASYKKEFDGPRKELFEKLRTDYGIYEINKLTIPAARKLVDTPKTVKDLTPIMDSIVDQLLKSHPIRRYSGKKTYHLNCEGNLESKGGAPSYQAEYLCPLMKYRDKPEMIANNVYSDIPSDGDYGETCTSIAVPSGLGADFAPASTSPKAAPEQGTPQ